MSDEIHFESKDTVINNTTGETLVYEKKSLYTGYADCIDLDGNPHLVLESGLIPAVKERITKC